MQLNQQELKILKELVIQKIPMPQYEDIKLPLVGILCKIENDIQEIIQE